MKWYEFLILPLVVPTLIAFALGFAASMVVHAAMHGWEQANRWSAE